MPRPEKRIQNLSPREIADLFISEFSGDTSAPDARAVLSAFEKKTTSGEFSEDQTAEAKRLTEALLRLYQTTPGNRFDRPPEGDLKPSPPSGMVWTPTGELILADDFNHRIQVFDAQMKLKTCFGQKGKQPGEFQYPKGIALDAEGHLYVTDSWNHRVQKFDLEGNFIQAFGEFGEGPGQMNEPWDVLVEPGGRIVVVERYNHRLQFFSAEGRSLGWMGARATVFEDELAFIYGTSEAAFPRPAFEFPTSIARDSSGHFYISDSANHRILKFDSEWNQILAFGKQGEEPGQFQYPMHVVVDAQDLLYVADLNNDRIQKFTPEGVFITAFSKWKGDASLKMPTLLALDPANRLWVGLTLNTTLYSVNNGGESCPDVYRQLTELQPANPVINTAFGAHLVAQGQDGEANAQFEQGNSRGEPVEPVENLMDSVVAHYPVNGADSVPAWLPGHFNFLSQSHTEALEKLLAQYREWIEFYPTLIAKRVEEQNRVLENHEDPLAFDRDFHELKNRDRDFFYRSRHLLKQYKKSVLRLEDGAHCLLRHPLDNGHLAPLMESLQNDFMRVGETVRHLLKQKERNEAALVQVLQQEGGVQQHWSEFVSLYGINGKILELLRQLAVELVAIIRTAITAANRFPEAPSVQSILSTLGGNGAGSLLFCQLLLGFQEDIDLYRHLQGVFKNLLDVAEKQGTAPAPDRTLPLESLRPLPYDTETLAPEELLRSYRVGGGIVQIQEGPIVGGERIAAPDLAGKESEVARHMLEIVDNHQQFPQKFEEMFEQVRQLRLQKSELESRLMKLDVRDRVSPIQIGNNVMVVDFQTALLNRMILTLEINETQNLARLLTGSALLAASSTGRQCPEFILLADKTRKLRDREDALLEILKTQWKSTGLNNAQLNGHYNASSSPFDAEEVARREQLKKQLDESTFDCLKTASGVYRSARTLNLLNRLHSILPESPEEAVAPAFASLIGCFGQGRPDFLFPFGVSHSANGDLFVSDTNRHCILKFSPSGVFQTCFGKYGNGPGALSSPYGIRVGPDDRLYVADHGNRRIQVFNANGTFHQTLGNTGTDNENVAPFFGLDVDRDNRVWVPDCDRHRILVYSSEGVLLHSFGASGTGAEALLHPVSVLCLEDGGYVVGDRSASPLKRFDREGRLVRPYEGGTDRIGEPYGLAFHPECGLLVSDTYHCQIVCLNLDLQPLWFHNKTGRRAGQNLRLGGISVNNGHVVTADYDNIRVQALKLPTGKG